MSNRAAITTVYQLRSSVPILFFRHYYRSAVLPITRLAERSLDFEDSRAGHVLIATPISSHFLVSLAQCSRLCLFVPECLSFNYCSSKLCRLNSQDALTDAANFANDVNCMYFGMMPDGNQLCNERGHEMDSLHDQGGNFLQQRENF